MRRSWTFSACIAIAVVSAGRLVQTSRDLPARVASHFGADGSADDFQTPTTFLIMSLGMLALMVALFLGLPWLMQRFPPRMINIPNREYWLSDARKADTLHKLGHHLGVIGVCTLAFMAAVYELVIRANLRQQPLDGAWMGGMLVALYAALITRIVLIYREFRLPPDAEGKKG